MTLMDFIHMHQMGAICAVLAGVAGAWLFADGDDRK